jgi:uncharacterized protein YgbK (DUF1537 family)
MIALADDLTGAAEIGGIAWRYGLPSSIAISQVPDAPDGLGIVDTESRTLEPRDAAECLLQMARSCRCPIFFKKIDSALRGPVVVEVDAVMKALRLPRALIVAANPGRGRSIQDGIYCIHGVPLAETEFREDPEYPAQSSSVEKMLPGVEVLAAGQELGRSGMFLGEAATMEDLRHWARQLDGRTLAVGAADFFRMMLEEGGYRRQARTPEGPGTGSRLFVSGTASERSRRWFEMQAAKGYLVAKLPQRIINGESGERIYSRWTRRVSHALYSSGEAAMIIGRQPLPGGPRISLSNKLASGAADVIAHSKPALVCVEGGATASALAGRVGWSAFDVREEFEPGVVVLDPRQEPFVRLVLKPGSYPWSYQQEES